MPRPQPTTIVQDPPVGSVVVGPVPVVRAFVIGRRAQDVEVAVEVDVDLAAVVLGDLDLVVALFVADLGARNVASVGVVERDALGLLDAGSGRLLLRGVAAGAGSISHARPDKQQHRDRRRYQPFPYVYCSRVHSITSLCPTLGQSIAREPESSMRTYACRLDSALLEPLVDLGGFKHVALSGTSLV